MELSNLQRLQLINQYEILANQYRSLGAEYSHFIKDCENKIEILYNGFESEYYQFEDWLLDPTPKEIGREVKDILNFYRAIHIASRKGVNVSEIELFGGFDGNDQNESDYLGYVRFLIEKEGKWEEQLKYKDYMQGDKEFAEFGRTFNSHSPMLHIYKAYLKSWRDKGSPRELDQSTIDSIAADVPKR